MGWLARFARVICPQQEKAHMCSSKYSGTCLHFFHDFKRIFFFLFFVRKSLCKNYTTFLTQKVESPASYKTSCVGGLGLYMKREWGKCRSKDKLKRWSTTGSIAPVDLFLLGVFSFLSTPLFLQVDLLLFMTVHAVRIRKQSRAAENKKTLHGSGNVRGRNLPPRPPRRE